MGARADIDKLLLDRRCVITYHPLRTEVPILDLITLPAGIPTYEIPARAGLDPVQEAQTTLAVAQGDPTALLIPGRRFDALGTRHGQGGGWYDRFLTYVPRAWLRIGVCYEHQFSSTSLMKEPWDQPMDYVIVVLPDQTLSLYACGDPVI
ncbi:MAG: hypothetical protein EPO16_13280 [Dehalococcoidia bacterium]|nr:MAG: hypothetical protein EPO16_13280 [Dehalococcoidia bacterium]